MEAIPLNSNISPPLYEDFEVWLPPFHPASTLQILYIFYINSLET